jgi:uncharacterized protein (TIGR02270 family)
MIRTSEEQPLDFVVEQHVEESALLRNIRSGLIRAPHVKLHHLRRFDDRLAAHLDGVAIAGEFGWGLCRAALETPGIGEIFTAAVRAIEARNESALEALLALAQVLPESAHGLESAFGWLDPAALQGLVRGLLTSEEPFRMRIGIVACALHRVDPGNSLITALRTDNSALRSRALCCAAEIGRQNLLPACLELCGHDDPDCCFWAAWSAALLGDRQRAVAVLREFASTPNHWRSLALRAVLLILGVGDAHEMLKNLARDPANRREVIRGTGITGNPYFVPWLITQMKDDETARLAGESFSLITGADLASLDIERKPPRRPMHAEDSDLEMDEDRGLPWPDPERVSRWWAEHQAEAFPSGTRLLMGAPITVAHCIDILRNAYQRQRVVAAHTLCLLNPGTPLFNTSAPAWRQQRLLAQMS